MFHTDLLADARIQTLISKFSQIFGAPHSTVVARAPGRVNAIGEHVDYSGGSVLPLAVKQVSC